MTKAERLALEAMGFPGHTPTQHWTVRCQTCTWVCADLPSYTSAQKWAKYHRTHEAGHETRIRKGSEEETR